MPLILWWGDHPLAVLITGLLAGVGLIFLAWSLAVVSAEADEIARGFQPRNVRLLDRRKPFDWAELPEYADEAI